MHYTLERIMNDDETVMDSYGNARALFSQLFDDNSKGTVEDWAQWLTSKQHSFELECGGRYEGQEVMAWAGFGMLYKTSIGFEGNEQAAEKLARAFLKSFCSLEVKSHAEEAIRSYHIDELLEGRG